MSTDPLGRGEKFLSRWSRRKQAEPESREREDARVDDELAAQRGLPARSETLPPGKEPADLPSIESLTPSSDFTRFMRADVPPSARNAAMKKLFGDPHFNVMDGLDIYIDDYTKSDPIPLAMLRDLAQSRMLHLFDYEDEKAAEPASAAPVASSVTASAPVEAILPQPGNAPADIPATDQPKPAAGSVD